MEITFLTSEQYVEDRYKDLRRKRPEEKEMLDGTADGETRPPSASTSAAKRFDALKSPRTPSYGVLFLPHLPADEQVQLHRAVHELEAMWPVTLLDKKLTLLHMTLDHMVLATRSPRDPPASSGGNEKKLSIGTSATSLEALPLSTQLAVKLFFRLIQTIRSRSQASGQYGTLLRLIHQLPRMLVDLPPLALCVDQHALTSDRSIFEEIFSTVQQVAPSTREDMEAAFSTLVGLGVKRGRLYYLLLVVRLLLETDPTLPMQLAMPFLRELVDAKAQDTDHTEDEGHAVGYLMSFGKGDHGKLGHGTCNHPTCADHKCTENKIVPTMLESTRDVMFKKIDSLSTHSVAVSVAGELFTWGNGEKFRLGHGDASKEYLPRLVEAFRDKPRVKDVACGLGHTVVLLVTGDVYAWGNGGNGRLGLGDTVDQSAPTKVPFPDESDRDKWSIAAVFCGASHSLAITQHGRLFSWGKNNQGQCGHGHTNDQLMPAEVLYFDEMELRVSTVAGGWEHTLICTTSGKAYACGCGYKDSRRAGLPPVLGLGLNDTERRVKPALIPVLDQCVAVACGWDHSLALTKDGSVYSWGSGSNGKLGHGDEDNRDTPTKIQGLDGKTIQDVKAGCEHTTAITATGDMYTWGHSDSGRLGHGDNLTRKTPCFVESFAWQGYRPVSIAVGDKYNLVIVQSVADGKATNQFASPTKSPSVATVPSAAVLDESVPLTASILTRQMMGQLDRLASAYMPQDNDQLLDKLRLLHMHPTTSPAAMAYAVDVSNETFELLVDIIAASTATQDPVDDDPKAVETKYKASASPLVLTSLRLIKVNLYHLLSCPQVTLAPSMLEKLYTMLQALATSPATDEGQEMVNQCAADALKIGFQIFYPTGVAQHELLWQLMHMTQSSELILLQALTDRLCQDYVIVDLMTRLFAKSHTCVSTVPLSDTQWNKDDLSCMDLMVLMTRLLKQCAPADSDEPRMQLQLKMLAVLQTHLFSAWNSSFCTHCVSHVLSPYLECLFTEGLNLLRKVHKGLLKDSDLSKLQPTFFHMLVPLAVECIAASHLRSHTGLGKSLLPVLLPMLKLLDEITYKMSEDAKLNNQAVPAIDWIAELESACALLVGRYVSMLVSLPHPAIDAHTGAPLCLKYVCRHGTMREDHQEDLLRKWEAAHVYEIEHELQPPEPLPNDVTLVDHMAILDWVQGHGVLDDFHKYMLHFVDSCPATVEVIPLAIVIWHGGWLPSVFACIASIGTTELKSESEKPPPPTPLLHIWQWVIQLCSTFECPSWDVLRVQGKLLLQYYPCQCVFAPDAEIDIPHDVCRHSHCSVQPMAKLTISLPQLLQVLSEPIPHLPVTTPAGLPLKLAGLSILHDLLCKLTSNDAKCELLRVFIEPAEVAGGHLSLSYNAWQEPRVEFHPMGSKKDMDVTPLQVLEHDMHTQYGIAHHRKLNKALENLYIRLAKLVASPESTMLLKKRALNLWCVDFHDISILRHSGILHSLGELLQHEASVLSVCPQMNIDDAIHNSIHGLPASLCLPPRMRPVEKLVYMSTATYNLHAMCWHVFTWLSKQFMLSEDQSLMLNALRPSASAKALLCASPRKRLSLPPKLIVSTLEESIDHMYQVLLQELAKTKDSLALWNAQATQMAACIKESQALLLADPHIVSSVNSVFMSTNEKAPENGWTLCLWVHVEDYSSIPLILVANGDAPQFQMALTIEDQGRLGLQWNSTARVTSTQPLTQRGWTHVACTFSKEATEIYINGVLDTKTMGEYSVAVHPTFTVGGLVDPLKPEHHTSHILLDDLTIHGTLLSVHEIQSLASTGSLLFRIKQRQILDRYCTSLLSLLAWLALVKAPPMASEIPLLLTLLPLCPPSAHPLLFQLLACVLPPVAPLLSIPSVAQTLLAFLIDQFGLAWFSSTNVLHGPPDLYQALTVRKDNCVSHLLRAGHFESDGVASWLVLEQPLKSKSLSLLRSTRASLVESFVMLFRSLLHSPAWATELFNSYSLDAPDMIVTPTRASVATTAKDSNVVSLVLSIYVLGGYVNPMPPPLKMHDAMLGFVEWVLKHPVCIDGHGSSADDMEQDIQIAIYTHLRVGLLRLSKGQSDQLAVAEMLLTSQSIVSDLLSLAIQPLPTALAGVFGKEYDIVSKMENVHALIDWIADESNEDKTKKRVVVETLAAVLFERLPYMNGADVTPWWVLNAAQNLHVLGGEVEIDEYRIKGLQHFPTVKLNGVSITADTGIWYYEVVLLSDGLMQIGWIDTLFESDALQGQGVGDHTNSWAYDGFRRKKWNVGALDYGERWHSGDVIGVLLDTDRYEMQYFINGRPLGVAFEGLRLNHAVFPAMSLNVDQSVQFHFTANQFLYLPPLDKIQPVSSAILGHVCEHQTTSTNRDGQEQETRRTELIEGLIGLGFPPEWALRCARETSMDLSESGAIAWIMEQMENDANATARPTQHGFDISAQNLQQLDGFVDEKKKPTVPDFAVPAAIDATPTNPFLSEEFCEDAYGEEHFPPPTLPRTSHEAKPNDITAAFVLGLADTCRDEEILPLYLIAESALSISYAQDTINHLVQHTRRATAPGFPETLFLEFVQHVIAKHPPETEKRGNYGRILQTMCRANPRFVTLLVEDMMRHFQGASTTEFAHTSFVAGASRRMQIPRVTLTTGSLQPTTNVNMEWACWLSQVLFTFARGHANAKPIVFAPIVWQTLLKASMSSNATLRHRTLGVMTAFLQANNEAMDVASIQLDHVIEWLAAKVRKEKPTRTLFSEYTQSLFHLVVTLDSLLPSDAPLPPTCTSDLVVEHVTTSSVVVSSAGSALPEGTRFQLATHSVVNGRFGVSAFEDIVDPLIVTNAATHALNSLQPDTTYCLRAVAPALDASVDEATHVVTFQTPCESVLELDPTAMGSNLELLNHNMTVRNRVNKKWHAVRASVAYTSGVHSWDVRIDKCVSKNIFVGICTADASVENYIGSDACGWGFLANKAVWHNKSKLQTYGDIFKQGDVVTVTLNLDRGTLSFARNGDSFGVGVEHLHASDVAYFPALSMYNKDDQVTFLPHETLKAAAPSGVASVMRAVRDMQRLARLFDTPDDIVYDEWVRWTQGQLQYVVTAQHEVVVVDVTDDACASFGFRHGDVVFTAKGMCTVLGVADHVLWHHMDLHAASGRQFGHWNVQTCRDMLARPTEFPVTQHHVDRTTTTPPIQVPSAADFVARQAVWTHELDDALVNHLQQLADIKSYESVFDVPAADIAVATCGIHPTVSSLDCLVRAGVVLHVSRLLRDLVPFVTSLSPSPLLSRCRRVCVQSIAQRFIREMVKKTTTLTMPTTTDDMDDDPLEMPKCKLVLPATSCVPYWDHASSTTVVAREASLVLQVSAFCDRCDPRDLRRHYAVPQTSIYASTTQPRTFRVVCDDLPDPSVAYIYVFREIAREVQSERVPLFRPILTARRRLAATMINPAEKDTTGLYYSVGRVMGMAWRADIPLPWFFAPLIWKWLVHEPISLADWVDLSVDDGMLSTALAMATWTSDDFESHQVPFATTTGDGSSSSDVVRLDTRDEYTALVLASLLDPYRAALDAMAAGLASIIPLACLLLLSATQLQRLLASSLDMIQLQERTTYGGDLAKDSPTARGLWKIVHGFSAEDQRYFCRFLVGHNAWHDGVRLEIRSCPPLNLHALLDEPTASGYGYPYVERQCDATCVLYLPEYANHDTLQKKLLLAMTHSDHGSG
ncbi:Aste57867_11869 [Aphanomyces stellatus]|uniref:Aste57867_11869 protein n=1 Tax=Aphanomyces stellatus TaxID=120398 RepID=A0A485KUQ5_9STRA|nr:hypothetical protein As57867_011824 [Aphanomyces stellatus]VFT88724.1 Aste57867_11869 [Aphanomyces stellatus]